jgi:hypothetical protein
MHLHIIKVNFNIMKLAERMEISMSKEVRTGTGRFQWNAGNKIRELSVFPLALSCITV